MKKSKLNTSRLSAILVFLGFIAIALAGCSSGSSSPYGQNNGNGGNGGSDNQTGQVSFDSGNIAPGKSYSFTFQNVGTTPYYCKYHYSLGMKGKVIVKKGASKSGTVTVTMKNDKFNPASITIAPGTTVKWVNKGSMSHTATSGTPSSGSGGGY